MPQPLVSVLMPTYQHAFFVRRAIASLYAQTFDDWELVIIDDGSPDATATVVQPLLDDPRIHYHRLSDNMGLGTALNTGLRLALGSLIAYLPSDDIYYPEHLASLVGILSAQPSVSLAYSGLRHHYNRSAVGQIDGTPLQLVQVMHHRIAEEWLERTNLVTDDLERMYWHTLRSHGPFVATEQISAEWVDHPGQMHKVIQEPLGGINPFRARYQVKHPLRFHTSVGNLIDEVKHYRRFRERPDTPLAADGLKILLVGELAYNADRVLAIEERGHKLYGLWTDEPAWFNMVGPMPFGHVEDLPRTGWREAIKHIQPDIIYALLNWQTVPFAHHVLSENPGIPFIWHFKEGPFICLEKGTWNQLVELYIRADGQIYSSPELRDWFETVVPGLTTAAPALVLDGDLPKRDWFTQSQSTRLSQQDGELHTVVPGRPIGLHPWTVGDLAEQRIHLHFYGDFTQGIWRSWIEKANRVAAGYLHLHPNVDQDRWVTEFSQYDAGWLHFFRSENGGDVGRANWDDLNYPARIATLAVAGLPLLQYDNHDALVASQTLARRLDLGLFFTDMAQLRQQLCDASRMQQLRDNVWRQREQFIFDTHADNLISFLRQIISQHTK